MKHLAILAFFLILLMIIPVYALYLEIPASTANQSYVLNIEPPIWLKITLKDMVANRSMDNVALTFRDPATNELFHIYIKTSGEVWYAHQSPQYLGKWNNNTDIYVGLFSDKVILSIGYPTSSSNKTELPVPITRVYDVRVHSNDDRNRAFLSGTIVIEKTFVVDPGEITTSFSSLFPLIMVIAVIAIPLAVLKYVMKMLGKIL